MKASETVNLTVNADPTEVRVPVGTTLAELLRDSLGLRRTKVACWEGVCGACTVLMDGAPAASCSVLAHDAHEREILTAEATDPIVTAVSRAFEEVRAYQCGFCTAGFIMAIAGALRDGRTSEAEVLGTLDANYCRCGTYPRIKQAVALAVARVARSAEGGESP
jgi:aerobic-type carbon monoxide dehydrogenase small subunit (CoxS/CutS family)